MMTNHPPRRGRPTLPRCCGNCGGIRYSDAQLLSNIGGTCVRSDKSGRVSVKCAEEACPFFTLRSTDKRKRDATRREDIRVIAEGINRVAGQRRQRRA